MRIAVKKRMKALNTCPKNCQPGPVRILGFLILCFLSSGAIPSVAKQPLFDAYKRIIVLDPGHGGRESGARGADGTAEKAVALKLAELIATELERDYKVTLTRTDDYHVDLDHRTALANHLKADIFISLHTGGSFVYSSAGPIVYYYQNAPQIGEQIQPCRVMVKTCQSHGGASKTITREKVGFWPV